MSQAGCLVGKARGAPCTCTARKSSDVVERPAPRRTSSNDHLSTRALEHRPSRSSVPPSESRSRARLESPRPSPRSSSAPSASRPEGSPNASTLERVGSTSKLEGALAFDPASAFTWWMRPGPRRFCADGNSSPPSPEHAAGRHADAREARFAMRTPAASGMPEHRHGARDLESGGVRRDDEHRSAPVRLGVRIGDRHHDRKRRPSAPTRTTCVRRSPIRHRRAVVEVDHVRAVDGFGAWMFCEAGHGAP